MVEAFSGAGLLVELEALGNVLEANEEWQSDAAAIRARMLRILSLVASRFLSSGVQRAYCRSEVSSMCLNAPGSNRHLACCSSMSSSPVVVLCKAGLQWALLLLGLTILVIFFLLTHT